MFTSTLAPYHQPGTSFGLTACLFVFRVTISDTDHSSHPVALVDSGAMDRMNAEDDNIAAFRRDRHGVFQIPCIGREVRCASSAVFILPYVFERSLFVRSVKEANAAVMVIRVVEMDEAVNIAAVLVFIEGPVLMHREGLTGFRGFGV